MYRLNKISNHSISFFSKRSNRSISFFSKIPLAPSDPILSLTTEYLNDPKPHDYKINLGVGAYRDDRGKPWVLDSVRLAEIEIAKDLNLNHEYIPILGTHNFVTLVQKFLFQQKGMDFANKLLVDEKRIITSQGISGTGSLRVIGEFLNTFVLNNKKNKIAIPNPSWANHKSIFINSGIEVCNYRYYNPINQGLDLNGMLEDLNNLNEGDCVLLHVCCHNPTGIDPNNEEWDLILKLIESKNLLPIFDMAYQGFSKGIVEDIEIIEKLSKLIIKNNKINNAILAQSFAKNMGLYGERVGSISIITKDQNESLNVSSQLKRVIRSMYSSPPCYGSKIVEKILSNENLYNKWCIEVGIMRNRLKDMRHTLFNQLIDDNCHGPGNGKTGWEHLLNQNGMFCFTGLTNDQVLKLKEKSIYMTGNGRISIAGINNSNVKRLSNEISKVIVG